MTFPTLDYENSLWKSGVQYVAGVDEVGRGALAGPVVAAAVVFDPQHVPIAGIRDSKTLSKLQKNTLQTNICDNCTSYAIGEASAQEIDELGIVPATVLAMHRALEKITAADHLLIDGLAFKNKSALSSYQKTFIVKGDSLSYSIAAASIIAKVYRDTLMVNLAKTHPMYSWETNVGYGTNQHRSAITKHGACVYHRQSFLSSL